MKKKLLSTVLAAAMVLTMTACGNNAQEPAAETGAAAETESAGAETESAVIWLGKRIPWMRKWLIPMT